MKNRPGWYTDEHDSSWDRVKSAFRRDWEQTKNDFGSDKARDLNQDAGDTVRQATTGGSSSDNDMFDRREPAFRFGHAAQRHYRSQYPTWNNDLETRLRQDYGDTFDNDRQDIRNAYEYRYASAGGDLGSNQHIEANRNR
jgi:hypothetical protein